MNISNLMEDERGTPWVARIPWFWAVPLSLITAGAFPLIIGIYLSAWVRDKRNAGFVIYGYAVIGVLAILEILLARIYLRSTFWVGFSDAGEAFFGSSMVFCFVVNFSSTTQGLMGQCRR